MSPRDPRAFLWDVQAAATAIESFLSGLNAETYAENEMAQAAVERKFEIIGEALGQLAKADPALAARVPELAQIVAFRNQLIHGYATIRVRTVWQVAQESLPTLSSHVAALLKELG